MATRKTLMSPYSYPEQAPPPRDDEAPRPLPGYGPGCPTGAHQPYLSVPVCPCLLCAPRVARSAKGKAKPAAAAQADDGFQAPGKAGKKGRKKGAVDPSLLGFSVESSRIMQGEIDLPQ